LSDHWPQTGTDVPRGTLMTAADGKGQLEQAYESPVSGSGDLRPYRAISRSAVVSFALALSSLLALVFPVLLVLAAVGFFIGLLARRNLRTYPDELTGNSLALVGVFGCLLLFFGGAGWHTYVYLTEVPSGYVRISFADLQPAEDRAANTAGLPVDLDGQRVFVKGYVHPGVSSMGKIRKFVLVGDMGTCCFGGQPKLTDMIEVTLDGARSIQYSQRKRKLGGILHVRNRVRKVAGGLDGGYYELHADYVK